MGVQLAVIPVDEYAALLIAGNDLQAVELLGGAAERGKFQYIGIEIGNDADHATMCRIVPAEPGPVKLQGLRFKQFFRWLTDSLKSVSASAVSDQDAVQYGDVSSWADLNALCA